MHNPCLYPNPLHRIRIRLQHKPKMPYSFLEGNLGGGEATIIVAIEGRFVEVFRRCVRVRVSVGKGVDKGREAAEGAEGCAAALERERGGKMQEVRKKERKFYWKSHRDWGLVGMKRIVLPPRYRVPEYPRYRGRYSGGRCM